MNYQNGHTLPRQPKSKLASPTVDDVSASQGYESPWLKRGATNICATSGEPLTTRNLESQQSVNAAYSATSIPSARVFQTPVSTTSGLLTGVGGADTGSAILAASRPHYSATLGRSSRAPIASLSGPKYRSSSATSLTQTDLYCEGSSPPDAYSSLRFARQQSTPQHLHQQQQQHKSGTRSRDASADRDMSLLQRYTSRDRNAYPEPIATSTIDRNSRARSADRGERDYDTMGVGGSTVGSLGDNGPRTGRYGLSRRETMPSQVSSAYATMPRRPHGQATSASNHYQQRGGDAEDENEEDIMARSMLMARPGHNTNSKDMLILDLQSRIAQLNRYLYLSKILILISIIQTDH